MQEVNSTSLTSGVGRRRGGGEGGLGGRGGAWAGTAGSKLDEERHFTPLTFAGNIYPPPKTQEYDNR